MKKKDAYTKKMLRKITFWDFWANTGWLITSIGVAYISGARGNIKAVTMSISGIVFTVFLIIIPFVKRWVLFPAIMNWEKDQKKAEKHINLYGNSLIYIPLFVAILRPLFSAIEIGIINDMRLFLIYMFMTIANVFLVTTFFSGITLRLFENWVSFVPVTKENTHYNIVFRFVVNVFFLGIALFFLGCFPFFRSETVNIGHKLLTEVIPLFFYGITILLLNIFIIANNLHKRIVLLQESIEAAAQGDYSKENIKTTHRDDLTLLVNDYNEFMDKNRSFLGNLKEVIGVSNEVFKELFKTSNDNSEYVKSIIGSIKDVSESVEVQSVGILETESTLEEVSRTLNSLNENVKSQASSITYSVSVIEEMDASIQSVLEFVNNNMDVINDLSKVAKEGNDSVTGSSDIVKSVIESSEGLLQANAVIQNISNQTNLLAMNAAIEAAHAGDAGKGFAVVADEIRKLAEESSLQGKNISKVLKDLKEKIGTLGNFAENVEKHFTNILNLLVSVNERSERISLAMNEQSSGSSQILEKIYEINGVTEQVKSGSQEMVSANEQIFQEIVKLVESSRAISNNMRDMNINSENIIEAIEKVRFATAKEKSIIEEVDQTLDELIV